FSRDWSSDVCSSDLSSGISPLAQALHESPFPSDDRVAPKTLRQPPSMPKEVLKSFGEILTWVGCGVGSEVIAGIVAPDRLSELRSEERRVGKEVDWR